MICVCKRHIRKLTINSNGYFPDCRVRFHYGHPDIFDRIFHLTRGGVSKASKTINLSEDVFAGKFKISFC